jgi:16S rRNA (uracil1498-N3)-methyltransferase
VIEDLRRSSAHVFVEDLVAPVLGEDDFHHLDRVMRLRRGEIVTCSDGVGNWITTTWDTGVHRVGEINSAPPREGVLTVAIAPVKGDRTEWVIEKLVELGIDRIVVLAPTDHSVVKWSQEKTSQVLERYRRIGRAAAMQSRQLFLPEILGPVALEAIAQGSHGQVIAYAEPGGKSPIGEVTTLVVGPEGGFSAAEVSDAPATVDLGGSILRADTAAIVGATLMVAHHRR